jgi:putative salt-induced outer membrane protein YdiY
MKLITRTTVFTAALAGLAPAFAQTVTPATADEKPKWESSAAAGLTLTRGNSESVLASIGLKAERKWDANEVKLGLDGLYGKTKIADEPETKSAESLMGFGQYNRLINEQLYGFLRVEGLHDGIAAIKYRLTVSPGVGYYFIKEKETELNAEAGPGFIYEKTDEGEDTYVTLRLAENFKHSLNDHVRVWQKAEFLPQVDDFENYILNFEAGIEADLAKNLSFQSKVIDTYDNQPVPGRKCNDLKWINSISYRF